MIKKLQTPNNLNQKELKKIAKDERIIKNQREKEMKIMSSLLSVNKRNFYFKPWIDSLQEKIKKNSNIYKLCLKDTDFISTHFDGSPYLKTSTYEIISFMGWKEYSLLTMNFSFFLHRLKESIKETLQECEKSNKFGKSNMQHILPTLDEIESILEVFERKSLKNVTRIIW